MRAETLDSQVQPVTEPAQSAAVIIVADDLTGACDSGVAFLASGLPVRVVLDGANSPSETDAAGVLAYTTETRNLPEQQAAIRVARTTASLVNAHPDAIAFKKIDSAARGNFGAEILAALDASAAPIALVAPAFPQAERTVHSGILHIRDFSGQDARISLRDQFPALDPSQIGVLPADSESNLLAAIRRVLAHGTRILLCDSETQQDLDRLARAGRALPQPILWAGSAGLARALAATLPTSTSQAPSQRTRRPGRTLLFSGSPHPVTQLQLTRLEEQTTPELKGSIIRLESDCPSIAEIQIPFTAEPVSSLILTGGDTAACVLQALGASSILLAGEIAPGIPWGHVEGGMADSCTVITKSGGFGNPDALVQAFEFSRRRPA